MRDELLVQVREYIRQPYAWPGGYPLVLLLDDGEFLCADCARNDYRQISDSTRHHLHDGYEAVAVEVNWESVAYCADCGKELEKAYEDER